MASPLKAAVLEAEAIGTAGVFVKFRRISVLMGAVILKTPLKAIAFPLKAAVLGAIVAVSPAKAIALSAVPATLGAIATALAGKVVGLGSKTLKFSAVQLTLPKAFAKTSAESV